MKLEQKYLDICYRNAMIMQYTDQLKAEGFKIICSQLNNNRSIDLYAQKKDDKRLYEFKYYKNHNSESKKTNIIENKKYAKSIGAKFSIVYLNPLKEKIIEFDELSTILLSNFSAIETPDELDHLSTHTIITDIEVDSLDHIEIINNDNINISGNATISVLLQYGSDRDLNNNIGSESSEYFPMSFTVNLDNDFTIQNFDYYIDTNDFYREE